jgi:hypothetical protein
MKYFKYFLMPFLFIVLSAKSQTKNIKNATALQYFIKEYLFKINTNIGRLIYSYYLFLNEKSNYL